MPVESHILKRGKTDLRVNKVRLKFKRERDNEKLLNFLSLLFGLDEECIVKSRIVVGLCC